MGLFSCPASGRGSFRDAGRSILHPEILLGQSATDRQLTGSGPNEACAAAWMARPWSTSHAIAMLLAVPVVPLTESGRVDWSSIPKPRYAPVDTLSMTQAERLGWEENFLSRDRLF
jgi:hypothetical protein